MDKHKIKEIEKAVESYTAGIEENQIEVKYFSTSNNFNPYKIVESRKRIADFKNCIRLLNEISQEEKSNDKGTEEALYTITEIMKNTKLLPITMEKSAGVYNEEIEKYFNEVDEKAKELELLFSGMNFSKIDDILNEFNSLLNTSKATVEFKPVIMHKNGNN